jgi:hypothetical protein
VIDKNGFLLSVMVTFSYFLSPVKVILADGGYRGEIIEQVKNVLII